MLLDGVRGEDLQRERQRLDHVSLPLLHGPKCLIGSRGHKQGTCLLRMLLPHCPA